MEDYLIILTTGHVVSIISRKGYEVAQAEFDKQIEKAAADTICLVKVITSAGKTSDPAPQLDQWSRHNEPDTTHSSPTPSLRRLFNDLDL